MGVSERLQRVKANFHEHPIRDWLLVAIGLGTLVVAIIALRNNSGSGTLSPVNPIGPTGPGGGGGGGGPTGPVNGGPVLGTGPGQPTGGTGGTGGDGITPGQWINTAPNATDSQSDPTYGKQPYNPGKIAPAPGRGRQASDTGSTPQGSPATYNPGSTGQNAPGRGRVNDSAAMTSSALHAAPTLNQTQQAPAHTTAHPIEQKPVLKSGVIRKGGVH